MRENAFQRVTREGFDRLIDGYAGALRFVLDHQTATLLVRAGYARADGVALYHHPEGLFPGPGHRPDPGHFGGAAVDFLRRHGGAPEALAAVILKDPDVDSLSSFIGVDGTNITLNSGRFLINLKPHDTRTADVSAIIERLRQATAEVSGISLYLQPVQDLTIDDKVSRTQYQFSLEDANPDELAVWAPRLVDKLNTMPQFSQVSSDISAYGLTAYIEIDRDTAAPLRHHAGDDRQCAV